MIGDTPRVSRALVPRSENGKGEIEMSGPQERAHVMIPHGHGPPSSISGRTINGPAKCRQSSALTELRMSKLGHWWDRAGPEHGPLEGS